MYKLLSSWLYVVYWVFKKISYKICGEWNSVKYFHISFECIWHWISSVLMLLLCTRFAKMKDLVCCNTQLNILRFRPELENQKKFIKPYWFIDIISICFLVNCYSVTGQSIKVCIQVSMSLIQPPKCNGIYYYLSIICMHKFCGTV